MRFEEAVSNAVERHPELRVYGRQSDSPRGRAFRDAVLAVVQKIARERARRSTIRALRDLDDHLLEDIGIARSDIRSFARALAYGEPQSKAPAAVKTQPAATEESFDLPKAA